MAAVSPNNAWHQLANSRPQVYQRTHNTNSRDCRCKNTTLNQARSSSIMPHLLVAAPASTGHCSFEWLLTENSCWHTLQRISVVCFSLSKASSLYLYSFCTRASMLLLFFVFSVPLPALLLLLLLLLVPCCRRQLCCCSRASNISSLIACSSAINHIPGVQRSDIRHSS